MKKFTLTALVLGVALMFAVPAMAVDVALDGYMRASGYLEKNAPMQDDEDDYSAYYDFRWRVNSTLTVSDMLRIRSRARIFNTEWGRGTDGGGEAENLEFERAWMVINTPYGLFEAGKMITKTFGTSFVDDETNVWRLNFSTQLGDTLKLVLTTQKLSEGDGGDWAVSDNDIDLYAFALVYPTENWTAGSLNIYIRNPRGSTDEETDQYIINPFFTSKFGMLSLQGEGRFEFGDNGDGDYKGIGLNLEGTYDLGVAAVQLGVAYISGQDETSEDTETVPVGGDWEKMFLLFGSTGAAAGDLPGGGGFGFGGNNDGFLTIYAGANTNVTEKLNVGIMAAWAQIDEPDTAAANVDDEAGVEVNVSATWQIYDNLTYTVIGAYLFAGQYWEDLAEIDDPVNGNDDAPWAIFHRLQLNF